MALISGRRSTLNPNAPLFVPAAMREVEDFSAEWVDLMTTSAWFKNYWLSQHKGEEDILGVVEDTSDANNVVGLLPETLDLDVDRDILNMETEFDEFLLSTEANYGAKAARVLENGFGKTRGPNSPMNNWEMQGKHVRSRYGPRFIQQSH